MRFNIVRSVKNPALLLRVNHTLLLRVNHNHKWDFLDNMGDNNWLDITNAQSTVPKGHDLRTYSLQNKYDLYDSARKNIRYILKRLKFANYGLSKAGTSAVHSINETYYKSILINYKDFDLESAFKQKEFWKRLNDETVIETYFVDIVNGVIDLEETSTLFDVTPKKISTISV